MPRSTTAATRRLLSRSSKASFAVRADLAAIIAPGFFSSSSVQLALVVGALVAIVAGTVGVFTVIRGQSFAGEALGDIGAAGGSSAYLVGIAPLWGFVGISVAAAGVMELIGIQRARGRDLATGIVLGAGFGLAALFLYLGTTVRAPPARRSRSCSDRSSRSTPRSCRSCRVRSDRARDDPRALPAAAARLGQPRARGRARGSRSGSSAACTCSRWPSRSRCQRSRSARSSPPRCSSGRPPPRCSSPAVRAARSSAPRLLGIGAMWLGILLAYDSYYWPPLTTAGRSASSSSRSS